MSEKRSLIQKIVYVIQVILAWGVIAPILFVCGLVLRVINDLAQLEKGLLAAYICTVLSQAIVFVGAQYTDSVLAIFLLSIVGAFVAVSGTLYYLEPIITRQGGHLSRVPMDAVAWVALGAIIAHKWLWWNSHIYNTLTLPWATDEDED